MPILAQRLTLGKGKGKRVDHLSTCFVERVDLCCGQVMRLPTMIFGDAAIMSNLGRMF